MPLPTLVVLSLPTAFSATWPTLAERCGLAYTPIESAADLDRLEGVVGIVSGGTEEELVQLLESSLRERPGRAVERIPFPATIATMSRAAAHAMLHYCDGNKSEAARRLGISRPRLQRLLDAHENGAG